MWAFLLVCFTIKEKINEVRMAKLTREGKVNLGFTILFMIIILLVLYLTFFVIDDPFGQFFTFMVGVLVPFVLVGITWDINWGKYTMRRIAEWKEKYLEEEKNSNKPYDNFPS